MNRTYRAVRWLNQFRHRARKTVNGINYELDLAEEIDGAIYFKGGFEPDTTAALSEIVRPGDVVFDVGANIGCHALLLAKLVQPTGLVIAFEPIEWSFQKLTRNAGLNPQFGNLKLERLAVSSHSVQTQEVTFRASWRTFGHLPGTFTDVVEMVSIDDYVTRSGIRRLDFIKIDVDGFEHRVIQGATNTLEQCAPALVMEFGMYAHTRAGYDLKSLAEDLSSAGYFIFHEKTRQQLSCYDEIVASIPKDETINVVCLHRKDPRLSHWLSYSAIPTSVSSRCLTTTGSGQGRS